MNLKKSIAITLILSIGLIGCSNKINNKENKNNVKKTVTVKSKKDTSSYNDNKEKIKMLTYTNIRFGFSIDYPKDFILKETSTNNDGAEMILGKAKIVVSGINNVLDDTIKSIYHEKLKSIKKESIKEKRIKDNYFSIYFIDKDMVHYTKTVVRKGSINSFTFTYPKDKKERYDFIGRKIEKSFKTLGIDNVH